MRNRKRLAKRQKLSQKEKEQGEAKMQVQMSDEDDEVVGKDAQVDPRDLEREKAEEGGEEEQEQGEAKMQVQMSDEDDEVVDEDAEVDPRDLEQALASDEQMSRDEEEEDDDKCCAAEQQHHAKLSSELRLISPDAPTDIELERIADLMLRTDKGTIKLFNDPFASESGYRNTGEVLITVGDLQRLANDGEFGSTQSDMNNAKKYYLNDSLLNYWFGMLQIDTAE